MTAGVEQVTRRGKAHGERGVNNVEPTRRGRVGLVEKMKVQKKTHERSFELLKCRCCTCSLKRYRLHRRKVEVEGEESEKGMEDRELMNATTRLTLDACEKPTKRRREETSVDDLRRACARDVARTRRAVVASLVRSR